MSNGKLHLTYSFSLFTARYAHVAMPNAGMQLCKQTTPTMKGILYRTNSQFPQMTYTIFLSFTNHHCKNLRIPLKLLKLHTNTKQVFYDGESRWKGENKYTENTKHGWYVWYKY